MISKQISFVINLGLFKILIAKFFISNCEFFKSNGI